MKIAVITYATLREDKMKGGHELRIYETFRRMALENEVHIFQYSDRYGIWKLENMIVHDIPALPGFLGKFVYDRIWLLGRYLFSMTVSLRVKHIKPDIADYYTWVFPLYRRNYKMVASCFIAPFPSKFGSTLVKLFGKIDFFLTKYKIKKSDYSIYLSSHFRRVFSDFENSIRKDSVYVPNGVDRTVFTPSDKNRSRCKHKLPAEVKLILYCSRLQMHKRPLDFLYAVKNLPSDYVGVIVGEGPLLPQIRKWISSNKMERRFLIKGFVADRTEVAEIYSACDVTVYPTEYEWQSLVPQESMACGTPVVVSNVAGNNEIVTDKWNGLLFELGDTTELTKQILKALGDEPLRNSLILNGLNYVESRTWERTASDTFAIYKKICGM